MNKKTKALTTEQHKEIIQTMRDGFSGCRPNKRIATEIYKTNGYDIVLVQRLLQHGSAAIT